MSIVSFMGAKTRYSRHFIIKGARATDWTIVIYGFCSCIFSHWDNSGLFETWRLLSLGQKGVKYLAAPQWVPEHTLLELVLGCCLGLLLSKDWSPAGSTVDILRGSSSNEGVNIFVWEDWMAHSENRRHSVHQEVMHLKDIQAPSFFILYGLFLRLTQLFRRY